MRINFKTLKFKNFMSYGNKFTEINFKNGIDLVTGENGIGKSSLISDALFYSLFGKPYRKTKLSTLINDINQKELRTEITFSIQNKNYRVVRGMKPNIFEIYINGSLLDQEASVKDYQLNLEENIIKTNEQSFRQLIILGANVQSTKPFLELPQSEKEEVFNSVINTSIFSSLLEVIKERTQNYKTQRVELEYKLEVQNSAYVSESNNIKRLKENNVDYTQKFKEKLKVLQDEYNKLSEENEKIKLVIQKTKNTKSKLDSLKEDNNKRIQENEETKRNQINNENNLDRIHGLLDTHSVCVGCDNLKKISGIDVQDEKTIEKDLEYYKKERLKQEEVISATNEEIEKLKNQIMKVKNFLVSQKNNTKRMTQIQNEINEINEYKFVQVDETHCNELQKEIEKTRESLKIVLEEINRLSNLKLILQDKSLKGAIIAQQLPILNKHINEYLEKFSTANFNMIIDNTFKERIVTSRSEEKEFNQLSSGQKFRLTFSLIFAFLKFIEEKNAISTNIMICDEVLDTSLDAQGRDDLLNILYNEFRYKNIIIISHNKEIQQKEEMFNRIINISKVNNFSQVQGN